MSCLLLVDDYLLELRPNKDESEARQSTQRVQMSIEEAVTMTIDKDDDGPDDTPPHPPSGAGGCKGACRQADAWALVDGEGKRHALLEEAQRSQG